MPCIDVPRGQPLYLHEIEYMFVQMLQTMKAHVSAEPREPRHELSCFSAFHFFTPTCMPKAHGEKSPRNYSYSAVPFPCQAPLQRPAESRTLSAQERGRVSKTRNKTCLVEKGVEFALQFLPACTAATRAWRRCVMHKAQGEVARHGPHHLTRSASNQK